jgi:hypothetical protein
MKPLKLSKLFSKSWLMTTNVINELKDTEIETALKAHNYDLTKDDFYSYYFDTLLVVVSDIIQKRLDDYYELVEKLDKELKDDTRNIGH